MSAARFLNFLLCTNITFIAGYIAALITSALLTDGELRVGLLCGFGIGEAHAILFFVFLMCAYFVPERMFSGYPHIRAIIVGLFVLLTTYLLGLIAIIITGSKTNGYLRVGLIVSGSVGMFHLFGFLILAITIPGLVLAN